MCCHVEQACEFLYIISSDMYVMKSKNVNEVLRL